MAYCSYWALFKAVIHSGKKKYPNLVNYYLGKTNAKIFGWFIFGVTFISANVYVCMSWNFIQYIIEEFHIMTLPKDEDNNFLEYHPTSWIMRSLSMGILFLIVLPIALMKTLDKLRFMCIANLVILAYIII